MVADLRQIRRALPPLPGMPDSVPGNQDRSDILPAAPSGPAWDATVVTGKQTQADHERHNPDHT